MLQDVSSAERVAFLGRFVRTWRVVFTVEVAELFDVTHTPLRSGFSSLWPLVGLSVTAPSFACVPQCPPYRASPILPFGGCQALNPVDDDGRFKLDRISGDGAPVVASPFALPLTTRCVCPTVRARNPVTPRGYESLGDAKGRAGEARSDVRSADLEAQLA